MSSTVSSASRAGSSSRGNIGTIKYGTVLSSGASAVYPSSFESSPQYNPNHSSSSKSGLSGGAIAGIVVAAVAFFLLVAFLLFLFIMRRRRANKQKKRDSQTALLPPPNGNTSARTASTFSGQNNPEMSQQNDTTIPFPSAPAAIATPDHANRKNKLQFMTGLSFGSSSNSAGHRRTDSANSTTPFLGQAQPQSPSRPSTGDSYEANSREQYQNRYSTDTATSYAGSPRMPTQDRFGA